MARGKRQEKDILENVNTPTIDESVSDYTFSKNNPNIYFNDITYKGKTYTIPTLQLSDEEKEIIFTYIDIRKEIYNTPTQRDKELTDNFEKLQKEALEYREQLENDPNNEDNKQKTLSFQDKWNNHLEAVLFNIYDKEKHLILRLIDKDIFYNVIVFMNKLDDIIENTLKSMNLNIDKEDKETLKIAEIIDNRDIYKDSKLKSKVLENRDYNDLWTCINDYKKLPLENDIKDIKFLTIEKYNFSDDEKNILYKYYDKVNNIYIDPLKSNETNILNKIQKITNYARPNEIVVSKNQAYNGLYYGNEEKIKNYIDKLEENNIDKLIVADINELVMETKNHSKENSISFHFDKNFKGLDTNEEKIINYALTLVNNYNEKGIPAIIFPSDFKKDYRGDYSNDKNSNKMTKEEKEQFVNDLKYLESIKVWVDYSRPIEAYNDNLKKGKKEKEYIYREESSLLSVKKVQVGQKNHLREGYRIIETPPFYTMLMQLGHITTIPKFVYSILNTNKTNDIILKYFIDKITSLRNFANWGIDKANNNKLYDITTKQQDYAGYDPNFFKIYQIQDGINEYEDRASWDKECREYGFSITLNIDTFIEENKLLDDTREKTKIRNSILNNILLFLTAVSNKYIANNVIEKPLIDDFDIIDNKGNILNKPNFKIDKYNKLKLLDINTIKKYENLKSIKLKITNIEK